MTKSPAATAETLPVVGFAPPVSQGRLTQFMRRLLRARLAAPSLALIMLVVLMAALSPVVAPYDPLQEDVPNRLQSPSLSHPFGTDPIGRDVLSRIIYGSRVSLLVGIISVGVAMVLGVPIGLAAGYVGGRLDEVLMRIIDAIIAFPNLVLALVFVAVFGATIQNVMLAIGINSVPAYARLVRSQVLSLRTRDFVLAAHAQGASVWRILLFHLLPNAMAPVIVAATLGMSFAILAEASLSFLGVGVRPPTPTWGGMLNESFRFIYGSGWLSIFPGLAIFLLVLALNFLGDALRDVLDPRTSRSLGME